MKVEREILEPMAGVPREIGFYLSGMEETRAELRDAVVDITSEELARRVLPNAHQIGGLILHIGEAESWWIHSIVAGKELDEEAKRFAHWDDTTETDFAEKNYSAKNCIEIIDEITRMSREILAGFSDEDLNKIFSFERPGKRIEISLRSILRHLGDHEATHKGQILMLKRLLRDGQN
ncbi:MAG TPA: DinB family protein [Pyrinomonadaceae bacterium]|nr:DinB family protein [Pyrinomonadaceae bacterium]